MPTELRKGQHYIMLYSSWFWVIVTGLHTADLSRPHLPISVIVPFSILSVLSFKIYTTINNLRQRLQTTRRQG